MDRLRAVLLMIGMTAATTGSRAAEIKDITFGETTTVVHKSIWSGGYMSPTPSSGSRTYTIQSHLYKIRNLRNTVPVEFATAGGTANVKTNCSLVTVNGDYVRMTCNTPSYAPGPNDAIYLFNWASMDNYLKLTPRDSVIETAAQNLLASGARQYVLQEHPVILLTEMFGRGSWFGQSATHGPVKEVRTVFSIPVSVSITAPSDVSVRCPSNELCSTTVPVTIKSNLSNHAYKLDARITCLTNCPAGALETSVSYTADGLTDATGTGKGVISGNLKRRTAGEVKLNMTITAQIP